MRFVRKANRDIVFGSCAKREKETSELRIEPLLHDVTLKFLFLDSSHRIKVAKLSHWHGILVRLKRYSPLRARVDIKSERAARVAQLLKVPSAISPEYYAIRTNVGKINE